MAFTTPGTAVAGSVLTSAFWNTNVRENTNAIRAAQVNVNQTVVTSASTSGSLASAATEAFPGLSVTITPTATTSKILISGHVTGSSDGVLGFGFFLTRNGSAINEARGDAASTRSRVTGNIITTTNNLLASGDFVYLDSPNSISLLTYAVTVVNMRQSAAVLYYNRTVADNTSADFLRGMSSIFVQEIPA
jgi:hypothetical protein